MGWHKGIKLNLRFLLSAVIISSVGNGQATSPTSQFIDLSGTQKRSFSVRDSIEMQLPLSLGLDLYEPEPVYALKSPNGKHVVVLTTIGSLDRNKNIYTLTLYAVEDLKHYITGSNAVRKPKGTEVMQVESEDRADDRDRSARAIQAVKWIDDINLTFIAGTEDDRGDVYRYNLSAKQLTRLTNMEGTVVAYDVSIPSATVIFLARSLRRANCGTTFPEPMQVGHQFWPDVVGACRSDKATETRNPLVRVYKASLDDAAGAVGVSREFLEGYIDPALRLSPDGRWATLLVQATHPLPENWADHFKADAGDIDVWQRYGGGGQIPQAGLSSFAQFQIVDTKNGDMHALFDAPVAYHGLYASSHWMPDSKSVVLTHTYLPKTLASADGVPFDPERLHVLEVNPESRTPKSIFSFYDGTIRSRAPVIYGKAVLAKTGDIEIGVARRSDLMFTGTLEAHSREHLVLSQNKQAWTSRMVTSAGRSNSALNAVEISVRQSLNTPPDFLARDPRTGKEAVFTSLNPQLADLNIPNAEVFDWLSGDETWRAGLVLPQGRRAGERVPLVVQVHCFEEHYFLRDSGEPGDTAPFAARALASAGFAVLQMNPRSIDRLRAASNEEIGAGTYFSDAVESAVNRLSELGIIDPERVGMIGWSAGGRAVLSALIKSNVKFGAAIISDAATVGPVTYALSSGAPLDYAAYIEAYTGGYPWGDGLDAWMRNQPFYHMDRVNAAIRLEVNNRTMALFNYDLFTVLKRQSKPVELLMYSAPHAPLNPMQRYIASQGAIEWMAFWLTGVELQGDAPRTAEQYARWRKLRAEASKGKHPVRLEAESKE